MADHAPSLNRTRPASMRVFPLSCRAFRSCTTPTPTARDRAAMSLAPRSRSCRIARTAGDCGSSHPAQAQPLPRTGAITPSAPSFCSVVRVVFNDAPQKAAASRSVNTRPAGIQALIASYRASAALAASDAASARAAAQEAATHQKENQQ